MIFMKKFRKRIRNGVFFCEYTVFQGDIQAGSQTGAAVRQCRVYAASDYKDK